MALEPTGEPRTGLPILPRVHPLRFPAVLEQPGVSVLVSTCQAGNRKNNPRNPDLTTTFQLHQEGNFADAARCYHALLVQKPEDAAALHLFGVLHHQNGYFARAVELIGRAVALRPRAAAFHANLAEAHRALGQHEQACNCCRAALRLQPHHPEAANNFGLALHDLGR